jgi:hypothetical protein
MMQYKKKKSNCWQYLTPAIQPAANYSKDLEKFTELVEG